MAERIVSPGVFTRERDLSFLPAGIAAIGACIIGPTVKGPAFVPTVVSNFPEFEEMFGSTSKDFYTPYAVEQYLRSAGSVTIVRVLNTAGYSADTLAIKVGTTSPAGKASGSFTIDGTIESGTDRWVLNNSSGTNFYFYPSIDGGTDTSETNTYFFISASSLALSANNLADEINSVSGTGVSASNAGAVLSISASSAGTGGNSITFTSGSSTTTLAGGVNSVGGRTLAVLAPSRGGSDGTAELSDSSITGNWSQATLHLSGSNWGAKSLVNYEYAISFDTGSANYIEDVFSKDAQVQKSGQNTVSAYLYKSFKYEQSGKSWDSSDSVSVEDGTLGLAVPYDNASTPSIQSQQINGTRYSLFKVQSRSHGSNVNNKYKIAVLNVKKAGTIAGSDYGSFSLQVRQTGLNDNNLTKDNILEQWDGLNFDPLSPSYFARRIGDRYVTIDANGKLTYNGDWPNMSKYIYVSDFSAIANSESPKTVVPMGHAAINNPFGSDDSSVPAWTVKALQLNAQGEFDSNVLYGHDYANADAEQYLAPVNSFGDGAHKSMSLEDQLGHADASTLGDTYSDGSEFVTLALSNIKQRKFVVPFQGGFDGSNPAVPKYTGANIVNTHTQGFDCSTSSTGGTVA